MTVKIYHFISEINSKDGGLPRAVLGILSNEKNQTYLVTSKKNLDFNFLKNNFKGKVYFIDNFSFIYKNFSLRDLNIHKNDRPLFHIHGIWKIFNHNICKLAIKNKIPYILQPHGMLEPWSLNQKKLKKKIALLLYQNFDIKNAKCIIATSYLEYKNLKKLNIKNPIAIIPNGIKAATKIKKIKKNKSFKYVLFLSRIHPKKGIVNLLNAWSKVANNKWKLKIAGPGDKRHLKHLENLIKSLKIQNSVEYIGEINDKKKYEEYKKSDLFVLPSFSENFGIVVAEALSTGLPVITTKQTPWESLNKNSCGWCIEANERSLTDTLNKVFNMSQKDLKKMSINAIKYSKSFYWKNIKRNFSTLYSRISTNKKLPRIIFEQ
jgi:glycosyltransferase involved in cell wall biosynthesis